MAFTGSVLEEHMPKGGSQRGGIGSFELVSGFSLNYQIAKSNTNEIE